MWPDKYRAESCDHPSATTSVPGVDEQDPGDVKPATTAADSPNTSSLTPPLSRLDTSSLLREVFDGIIDLPSPDHRLLPPDALERSINSWMDESFVHQPVSTTAAALLAGCGELDARQSQRLQQQDDDHDDEVECKPTMAVLDCVTSQSPHKQQQHQSVDGRLLPDSDGSCRTGGVYTSDEQRHCGLRISPFTAHVGVPCVHEFPGDLHFDASVKNDDRCGISGGRDGRDAGSGGKQACFVFSVELKKLYADMLTPVPFELRLLNLTEHQRHLPALFVRCMPIYPCSEWLSEPVERCPAHRELTHASNRALPADRERHFVRVATATSAAVYERRNHGLHVRRSVVVAWPRGSASLLVVYKFACMSTCIGGVARRSVALLFLLEDSEGRVYGRRLLDLKVCKCPRRDVRHALTRLRRVDGRTQAAPLGTATRHRDSSPVSKDKMTASQQHHQQKQHQQTEKCECQCSGVRRLVVPVDNARELDTVKALRDVLRRDRLHM